MNAVLNKVVNSSELTKVQLEAVKNRAIILWGEKKWLSKLFSYGGKFQVGYYLVGIYV